jgi:CubicO group peptidase (beta-lactamase class C family)
MAKRKQPPNSPLRKRAPLAVALSLLCLSTLSFQAGAQKTPVAQIDGIFAGVTSPRDPGLAALLRQNGRTIFAKTYGMRDLRSSLPITPETNFRLASFTKQFTAMAVMLLVHDGKLHYDDTLTRIFPDFPVYGRSVTVRNLLNHTGGLQDYETLLDGKYPGKEWFEFPQIHDAEVLAMMKQQKSTKFTPGTKWEYSNTGYVVLGTIVEKISGKSFGEFLRERVFQPVGTSHTIVYEYGKNVVAERAYGYTNDAGVWLETDQSSTSATLGDGGIYSSIDDLAKWDDAVANHKLLSDAEMQPALTPATLPNTSQHVPSADDGKPSNYGFGWFLDPYKGHSRMWHTGSTMGFRAVIERFQDDRLTVVILCNRVDLDPAQLALKVADLFLPPQN